MALRNSHKLIKTPILKFLNQSRTPARIKKNRLLWIVETIAGIILLGIGYWSMTQLLTLQLKGLSIALVTIVLGSYFIFDGLFLAII